jgi:uncharacterized phage protein (TIGR01671 family)
MKRPNRYPYSNDLLKEQVTERTKCNYTFSLHSIPLDKVELMQSTGLKDKNGKEIFEGDIVKMAKDVYSDLTYYEIVRHRGGAYRLESNQHGCELWLRHTNCEVIGNIYENPELLEVKE